MLGEVPIKALNINNCGCGPKEADAIATHLRKSKGAMTYLNIGNNVLSQRGQEQIVQALIDSGRKRHLKLEVRV